MPKALIGAWAKASVLLDASFRRKPIFTVTQSVRKFWPTTVTLQPPRITAISNAIASDAS